jgi:hypothetical protein
LDLRLTTLLCKKSVAKSKEMKTGWSNSRKIWQNTCILRKATAQKSCLANDDDGGGNYDE